MQCSCIWRCSPCNVQECALSYKAFMVLSNCGWSTNWSSLCSDHRSGGRLSPRSPLYRSSTPTSWLPCPTITIATISQVCRNLDGQLIIIVILLVTSIKTKFINVFALSKFDHCLRKTFKQVAHYHLEPNVTHLIEMSHMSEISEYEYYTWF